jgi:hypothetical protein
VLRVTRLPTCTHCVWGLTHCTVLHAHREQRPQHLTCLPAFWWVLLLRDENPRFNPIPDGSRIQIPKQKVSLSLFIFGFGDFTPINQNSKLYAGSRRTYNRRQGKIQARKRYGQTNMRRGNHTFRVRLCVTSGNPLRIQANLPAVPIHDPDPIAGPRATVFKATERKNKTSGNEIRAVRKSRKPS